MTYVSSSKCELLVDIARYLAFPLTDGGTPLLFWGFIVCAFGQTLVYASIAEMASMSPTAGGQYHWVSEFAPRKYQKILSYISGKIPARSLDQS